MILHNGSMCPGESCPLCRKDRGEDLNNPRIVKVNGAWQIVFRKGSKLVPDEITLATGASNA